MIRKPKIIFSLLIVLIVISLLTSAVGSVFIIDGQEKSGSGFDPEIVFLPEPLDGPSKEPRQLSARGNEAVSFVNASKGANIDKYSGNYFAWADYNNDGYQDLLVNAKRLLRNNGPPGWNFTDVTSAQNISYSGSINVGTWGDWNNDGYMDFYAAGGGWTTNNPTTYDVLWKNTGAPNYTFEDHTIIAGNVRDGYPSVASGWGDYDNDGYIDLYVANYENSDLVGWPDTLWHNNGDGTFTDISVSSGIRSIDARPGRGVAWCDYNNDGWNDIYISNYRIKGNFLWENQRDGTFKNVAPEKNCQGLVHNYQSYGPYYGHTIGSSWADYDNNGFMDIMVANLVHKYVGGTDIRGYICDDSNLYHNYGGPNFTFIDDRLSAGIPTKPIGGAGVYQGDELYSGVTWGDLDNDGDLDFWVPQVYGNLNYAYSYLYRNNNDGTFTDIANNLGIRVWNTYGSAWCDYNNDGSLDLVTGGKSPFVSGTGGSYEIHMFKNNGNSNNWLKVLLTGQDSNKAGIGARVGITIGQNTQLRQVEGGMGSHGQQNGFVVHFGVGSATTVNEVMVQWPNGKAQVLKNVAINQLLEITENITGPDITNIGVSDTDVLEDDEITFSGTAMDSDGTITKYEWDFDNDIIFDHESSSSAQTTHSYNMSGTHFAKLRVWDNSGNLFTDKTTEYITVSNQPPVAAAGPDMIVWEDSVIDLSGSQSTDTPSDLKKLEYNWTFDDDTYSGWSNYSYANHSYSLRGNYDVTLMVVDDDNVSDSDDLRVTVKNKPPSGVIISNSTVAEDTPIIFNVIGNDTPSDLPYLRYSWEFGDGNCTSWTFDTNTKHTYTQNGTYTVRCTIWDDDGILGENYTDISITVYNVGPVCWVGKDETVNEDDVVDFEGYATDTTSDRAWLRYLWDFADGNTSDWLEVGDQNITHVYTQKGLYQAVLLVKDNDGATCIKAVNITVLNVPPVCEIQNSDPTNVDEDETVYLNGEGTDTDSDITTLEYSWDLDITGMPQTPWNATPEWEFKYSHSGKYNIVLFIRDNDGDITNARIDIIINNVDPVAGFLASGSIVNEDEVIEFDARLSKDTISDQDNLSYTWTFDDSTPAQTGRLQQHKFTKIGDYRVRLTLTDDDEGSDTYMEKIKVNNVKPTAVINASVKEIEAGMGISFSGSASSDTPSDKKNLTYEWDFDDTTPKETGIIVNHSFSEPGRYKVKLTVTDDDNSEHTAEIVITITGKPSGSDSSASSADDYNSLLGVGIVIVVIILLLLIIFLNFKGKLPFSLPFLPQAKKMPAEKWAGLSPTTYPSQPQLQMQRPLPGLGADDGGGKGHGQPTPPMQRPSQMQMPIPMMPMQAQGPPPPSRPPPGMIMMQKHFQGQVHGQALNQLTPGMPPSIHPPLKPPMLMAPGHSKGNKKNAM